jgi:hypothetical protein
MTMEDANPNLPLCRGKGFPNLLTKSIPWLLSP